MRTPLLVASLVLVAGACGSPADPSGSGRVAGSTLPAPATTATTTATTPPPDDTQPGERPPSAYPEDGQAGGGDVALPLSIEDALLPEEALGAPWEFQWRQLDSIGYGAGPNQTDCDAYWAYETLLAGDGGHAMWWADGGNVNHRIIRIDSFRSEVSELGSMLSIARDCPVVHWNEGGSFTTELFDDSDAGALIMRFVDEASGDVTWVAVTLVGDLISLLQIPLWTRADGTMIEMTIDDVSSIAAQMQQRLDAAGPEQNLATTTSTIALPEPPTIQTLPPTTSTVPLDALGALLLAADDAPPGWELDDVSQAEPGGSDEAIVEVCPAAASLDEIDSALRWQAEFRTGSDRQALQLIGETGDAAAANAVVDRFAEVAQCDLTSWIPETVASGGPVDIVDADVAGTLFLDSPEFAGSRLALGAAAIGSIVMVFTIESDLDPDASAAQLIDFMTRGVAKAAAGS